MTVLSYAQNFEDVMLWRAVGDVERGQYLDIGAQDPVVDSVSLAFYEAGWRGVHVEPTAAYAAKLRAARPDEIVIEAAVSESAGPIEFYEIANTGISTGRSDIAEHHRKSGFEAHPILAPTIRLDSLLGTMEGDVQWMKVDVEGMEPDVLRSWGESAARPWILIIEATYPSSTVMTHHEWIGEVERRDYKEVFFDGLSRYFVHSSQKQREAAFSAPANVFDGFAVTREHFAARHLRGEIERSEEKFRDQLATAAQHREAAEASATAAIENETKAREELRSELAGRVALLERMAAAEREHSDKIDALWRERQQAESELRNEFNAANAELRAELARLENDLASSQAAQAQTRASLERADALIRRAREELPNRWQRIGEAIGLWSQGPAHKALADWALPSSNSPRLASAEHQSAGKETEASMYSSASSETRNPYLRANSLGELLAWHDLDFVRCAYVTMLGRQPDPQGEDHYVGRLRRGYSKYGILWELRKSEEGPRHDPGIAGLDRQLRKHRNARSRLYGWLVRLLTAREADTSWERRFRAIENLLGSAQKAAGRIDVAPQLEQSLTSQMATFLETVRTAVQTGNSVTGRSTESENVRGRLSPAARKFYDRVSA